MDEKKKILSKIEEFEQSGYIELDLSDDINEEKDNKDNKENNINKDEASKEASDNKETVNEASAGKEPAKEDTDENQEPSKKDTDENQEISKKDLDENHKETGSEKKKSKKGKKSKKNSEEDNKESNEKIENKEDTDTGKKEEKEENKKDTDTEKKEEKEENKEDTDTEKKEEKEENREDTDTEKKEEKEENREDTDTEKKEEKEENKEDTDTDKKEEKEENREDTDTDKKEDKKTDEKPEKKSSAKKGIIITLSTLLVLLLIAYFTGFWYFSSHFYTDVAINGVDVSSMDEPMAKQTLQTFYSAYFLTLHTIDNEDVIINGKDIEMKITLHEDFYRCFNEQKPYLWFVEIFNHHDFVIDADVAWNQNKLDDIYSKMDILVSEDIIDPADAYIGSDASSFVIMDEVMGNRLDEDKFKQQVGATLQKIEPNLDLNEADCYLKPEIYRDSPELEARLKEYGDYINCVVTIKLDDLEIEPSLDILDEVIQKSSSPTLSKTKIENYVKKLARTYDTVGTKRDFTTSFGGKHIQIEDKGFGYEIDQENTVEALYKAFSEKKPETVEVQFLKKGKTLLGDNDIGDTYIEANLTKQKVVAYYNGTKIAESDCVSGNISHGTGTCLGLYAIQGKQSPATLRGEMVQKSKTVVQIDEEGNPHETVETSMEYSYESHVTYWMPFNGGYGLHDADGWRSAYGGSIYMYSGSHGCINLPKKFAEELYKTFDVGTPVLVYYEDEE